MWRAAVYTVAGTCFVLAIALAAVAAATFGVGWTVHVDRCDGSFADQTVRFRTVRFCGNGLAVSASRSHFAMAAVDWVRQPPPYNVGWVVERAADRRPGAGYPMPGAVRQAYGFGWWYAADRTSWAFDGVVPAVVPIGLLTMPAAVLAAGRWRRSRRWSAHACPACGYDLRATPGRCPECGRAVQARPATRSAAHAASAADSGGSAGRP